MRLLDGVTVDTTGDWFDVPRFGGRGLWHNTFSVYVWSADFGGGSVYIEVSPDGDGTNAFTARRVDETQAIFTLSDVQTVRLRGFKVRARLAGATTPSALTAMLY